MKDTVHAERRVVGESFHNFGVTIMRMFILLLLLLGLQSEVQADGRVAITGVPVVGGHRTLFTAPPSEEPQYDDNGRPLSVPYPSTHYARNLPSHLTLGQGRIEGRPWYFNSNGYNSYHYGEHYQPTGGLTESYSGYTNSCGNSYSGNYSGGNLRELWVPIDRRTVPKMSVVTSPYPKYSGWYVNTPGFAGWLPVPGYIGPYAGYYDYLASQPVWGQHQGHLYDKRLYREPPGGWEKPDAGGYPVPAPEALIPKRAIPPPMSIAAPMESRTEVGYYTVQSWENDGASFTDGNKTSWKLAAGDSVHESLRSNKVKGYLVTVTHLDGSEKTYLHFVEWVDKKWKPTGQIWE